METTVLPESHVKALNLLYQGLIRIRSVSKSDPVAVHELAEAMHNLPHGLIRGDEKWISEGSAKVEAALRNLTDRQRNTEIAEMQSV